MFYDNFLKACNRIGKSPSAVVVEAGISKPAVTRWAKGQSPTAANVQKLADYFGISKEELTGTERVEISTGLRPRHILRDAEPEKAARPREGDALLDVYQGLSAENQRKAREYIEMLLALQDKQ